MRTTTLSLVAALTGMLVASCTVKDVDTPQLAGPSTLARSIIMTADKDTLVQDGQDQVTITLRSIVQPGQSDNIRLRAQVFVDGVAQDYGTLSNKSPIATASGTTITYRAPIASTAPNGQVATTVTIGVTPDDSGDFRSEVARQLDLRLIPLGVIQPINPNLVSAFEVTPASPKVLETAIFDATTSTNNGTACGQNCSYTWNFGDGTSGSGQVTTHQYRAVNTFVATLTVTDSRGATATSVKSVVVAPAAPPTSVTFTASPTAPGVNQDVFFDASASQAAPGRTLTNYSWSFGDGNTGSGVITTYRYPVAGTFPVILTVTDDAGAVGRSAPTTITVGDAAGPSPEADLQVSPAAPKRGQPVAFNASASRPGNGSNIVSYTFNYGDGSPLEVVTNPLQTHTYNAAGTFVVTVTVTDSLGRTASAQVEVEVVP